MQPTFENVILLPEVQRQPVPQDALLQGQLVSAEKPLREAEEPAQPNQLGAGVPQEPPQIFAPQSSRVWRRGTETAPVRFMVVDDVTASPVSR